LTTHDREARTARLAAAAATRTAESLARARRAITKLNATDQPVTFVSVARAGNVSTSFLYQHPELRREISRHRTSQAHTTRPGTPTSATIESLRTKLAAAVHHNRTLTEELALLRNENKALRSRLTEHPSRPIPTALHASD